MWASFWRWHCQIRLLLQTVPEYPSKQTQNCLRAAHVLIAFLTTAAETEQQDNANRSIGKTYCIGTAADGPYAAAGIIVCNYIVIVYALCT
jgi:hypothetical protein